MPFQMTPRSMTLNVTFILKIANFGLCCRKGHSCLINTPFFRVACEAKRHIGITLSGVCLSVYLSVCHTFLVVMHSYVSQVTYTFLGMLPLCFSI